MADQQDTSVPEMNDSDLFKSAMADTEQERPRDEQGRFKAAEEKAPPEAKAEPVKAEQPAQQEQPKTEAPPTEQPIEQKDEAQVPSWRLREVREAREAADRRAEEATRARYELQAQVQAMQAELKKLQTPKQEPVDFFAEPEKAIAQHLSPVEAKFQQFMQDMTLRTSRTAAIAQHGANVVAEMEQSIADAMAKNHPDMQMLALQMRNSDDPAAVAMSWYQRQKVWDATGGDPAAYKAKVLEEALKDQTFLSKAIEAARGQAGQKGGNPVVQIPPSLNRSPSAAGNEVPEEPDMSDRSLFRHAMSR